MSRVVRWTEARAPSHASLEAVESLGKAVVPDGTQLLAWYAAYLDHHRKRLAYDLDYVRRFLSDGSKLIELGSIPPVVTAALTSMGYDVHGVDIAPERFATTLATMRLKIAKVDIETAELPFPEASFDGALFNEVFEHLRINPIHSLSEVYRVLRPGGVLLLSTPNLTSLAGWRSLLLRNKALAEPFEEYAKLSKLGHMGHVREYTSAEVESFLGRIGFLVNGVIRRGSFSPQTRWKRWVVGGTLRLVPRLRPYFSVIATKPAGAKLRDEATGC